MKMYRYSAQLAVSGAVEAESLAEAERIIEGVLKAGEVTIVERNMDELPCTVKYTRGSIRAEV